MAPTLFKPDDDTTEEEEKENVRETLMLFALTNEQLTLLFDALQDSPETYTDAKASELLHMDIREAITLDTVLLNIAHMYLHHITSPKEIESELLSVGCEQTKVTNFVGRLGALNEKAKPMVDALVFGSDLVEDLPHLVSLDWMVTYAKMKERSNPKSTALLPIVEVAIEIGQEGKDNHTVTINFPITEIGSFGKLLDGIALRASNEVRSFKKEMDGKLLVPEG